MQNLQPFFDPSQRRRCGDKCVWLKCVTVIDPLHGIKRTRLQDQNETFSRKLDNVSPCLDSANTQFDCG